MTAGDVLGIVTAGGGRIIAVGDRLRVEAPKRVLTPQLRAAVAENKAQLWALAADADDVSLAPPTPVPAFRQALQAWFSMVAREANGDLASPEEAHALLAEINCVWAEVGPAFAEAVQRQEARTYHRETGHCPFCGQPGVFHDPETPETDPVLRVALAQLEAELRSGQIGSGPILVRGRPLADWLSLEEAAWWLRRAKR